jgi:hypothetical protein
MAPQALTIGELGQVRRMRAQNPYVPPGAGLKHRLDAQYHEIHKGEVGCSGERGETLCTMM